MTLGKKILSSAAALAIMGAAAIAADNTSTAIATDGTGDYLVFPVYAADANGNWKTNIKVVNTNTTHAVVAKVVIREAINSAEKLDFPIFLSPGDVWEATLEDVNGEVHLKTTDDSMVVNGVPASTTPVDTPLFAATAPQNNHYGYIEVYGIASIAGTNVDSSWSPNTPLDKVALYNKYVADLNGNTNTTDWAAVDADSIYGQEVLFASNTNGELAMTIPATAFEGVVGTNPNTVRTIGQNTTFASMITTGSATTVRNNITSLLAKSDIYATFYEGANGGAAETKLILTQPLKYAYGFDNTYCVTYQTTARDQEEHANVKSEFYSGGTPVTLNFCPESTWLNVDTASYAKGYTDYQITSNYLDANNTDTGVPAPIIPVLMTAKNVGGQNVTNAIYPAYKKQ
ncbi:hypothetical protein [Nitratiruptor sp. YY09-18]|uniref:hypothetical protein n=1 Tax=Nitratiruptor sp. YY09-18 TaxID=2724901 RepID=UPI0018EC84E6|nr:hypothetical protein [Nitratiruptor sp. YY09-18]BCD68942.1 hypothetical protein NitYY0918_P09 [Nitratiruptor sp. YY09-18]